MKTHIVLACAAAATVAAGAYAWADEAPHAVPAPTVSEAPASGIQTAVLSGGCFWGMQGAFEHVKGVKQIVAGYAGGKKDTAQYETVSTGTTGHAESIQIKYDPSQVTYGQLLRVYFSIATDPTQLNRQSPDEGTQYRGEIWTVTPDQKRVADAYIAQLDASHTFHHRIVTRVDAFRGFYPAEGYHQDFLIKNPSYPYIVYYDQPKIENLKKMLPELYVSAPVRLSDITPVKVE